VWPNRFDKFAAVSENARMRGQVDVPVDEVRRILVLRASALGDVVHTLPALSALRAVFPEAEIDWLVEPMSAGLLEGHPDLAHVYVMPRQDWKRRLRRPGQWIAVAREILALASRVRSRRYDLVMDFQGNLRSALALLLVGGRHRVGFHRRDLRERGAALFTNHRVVPIPPRTRKPERNLMLVRALGYEGPCPRGEPALTPECREWARRALAALPGRGPAVVIHPMVSRFGAIKRWPIEHFRTLIDLLGRHDVRILITWGPGEREIATSIGRPTVLAEGADLRHFAALLAEADLVVACDTGALPLAAAGGTPTVGLFGPKDAGVFAPDSAGEVVTSPAPCSPCRLRRCEHSICMTLISPGAVYEAAARVLKLAPA
jgi:lipopolysaccharide heptosyltransferase I